MAALATRSPPPPRSLTEVPDRPIEAKLELTCACNLRCGFCYTDSPRHTLQRTPELNDEEWREVVRQSLKLGQRFVRLAGDGSYLRLNESGGVVMDALDGGTPMNRRVVMAADASGAFPAEPGTSDLPGSEPNG